jgi:hypothetical protein
MADNTRRNNSRNNSRNNRNNYEEAEPYNNGNRPAGSKNWRLRFSNSRKVRPINKNGRSRALGSRHKTRTRRLLHNSFPDEENVLNMVGTSAHASRVAHESAALHAKHNTVQQMIQELDAMPMNKRIKNRVRHNLQRKFYNLTGPMPQRLPPAHMYRGHAFPPPSPAQQYPAYPMGTPKAPPLPPPPHAAYVVPANNELYQ